MRTQCRGETGKGKLGIIGLCQKDRRKVLAILGLVFNVLPVLGVIVLLIIGLLARA